MEFNGYVGLLVVSTAVSVTFSVVGIRKWKVHPAFPGLAILMLGLSWWSAFYALQSASTTLSKMVAFDLLIYPGVVLVPPSFLAVVLAVTNSEFLITRRRIQLLCIEPLLVIVAISLNPENHLFLKDTYLVGHNPVELAWTGGPFFDIHTIYSYLLLGVGGILLLHFTLSSKGLFRKQGLITLACAAIPWTTNAIFNFHLFDISRFDPTPVAFCLTGVGTAWALFRVRVADLVPVARDLLVETMTDAVIVIDPKGRIIDLNPAAFNLFDIPDGETKVLGQKVDAVLGYWASPLLNSAPVHSWMTKFGQIDLDVSVTQLINRRGSISGDLVLARDVTDYQKAQQDLRTQIETTEALKSELQELSIRDPLTGTFNRRHMETVLQDELAVARSTGSQLSIVLIDIDNFKEINDTFGHAAGDATLREVVEVFLRESRPDDTCCRFGGDEFLMILPRTPKEAATNRSNQWLRSCSALNSRQTQLANGIVFSAGIATATDDGADLDTLLQAADTAMYKAKNASRAAASK